MAIKLLLSISGIIMILQGLCCYFFSEELALIIYPNSSHEAIKSGTILLELMSGSSIFIGIVLYLSRKNVASAARRVLLGSSFGYIIIFLILLKILIISEIIVFLPTLILWGLLAFSSFYISRKKY